MNPIFAALPTTLFDEMSRLAHAYSAVNLDQGFPDGLGPDDVRDRAAQALREGSNQHPPMMGLPALREAIAAQYRRHQGLVFDSETEVMVTSGATEALAGALLGLIAPGDEVVLLEPLYDAYLPLVRRAGGTPRFVTLHPPHFRFEEEALARAFSDRTRLVIVNNPLNPSAILLAEGDLVLIAAYCRRYDALALCDEVWEHVVFDGRRHRPLIGLASMRERTVKIGSAGKIFRLTGWKVSFVMAEPRLMRVLARAHQFLTFTTPRNLQEAVAYGLAKDESFFSGMREGLARSRDRLADGLRSIGFTVLPSVGTYFLNVDIGARDDIGFCQALVREHAVAAIPVSSLYEGPGIRHLVRFCFAMSDATLDMALERLSRLERSVM